MTLELYIQERTEKAVKEAREENTLEMVKRMLARKIPIGDIVGVSGWSKEKIAQLSEEFKHEH